MTPETYDRVLAQIAATGETDPASIARCGTCGFTWDDGTSTGLTPAPAARCPNEYNHLDEDGEEGPAVVFTYRVTVTVPPGGSEDAGDYAVDLAEATSALGFDVSAFELVLPGEPA